MKELLILSGKGGSGKTSIAACFAKLAPVNTALVDCDVDASNLPLLIPPLHTDESEFFAGTIPEFIPDLCVRCGKCASLCRYQVLIQNGNDLPYIIAGCEGCGVCADHCPKQAVRMVDRHCGYCMESTLDRDGMMFHARLLPGAENSGKLIAELRNRAKAYAEQQVCPLIISDGPPGIGCPVISSCAGVDHAVLVTEPTVSGLHDMQRLMQLLKQFEVPCSVIINKCDLNKDVCDSIREYCGEHQVEVLGELNFDPAFSIALRQGRTVLDLPGTPVADDIKTIWNKLKPIIM